MTYAQKLKDPRWQKRRLEIMKRDNFACLKCHDTTKTLNVDHKFYRRGFDPWDYGDNDLQTLCEDCHQKISEARQIIIECLGHLDLGELRIVHEAIIAVAASGYDTTVAEQNLKQEIVLEESTPSVPVADEIRDALIGHFSFMGKKFTAGYLQSAWLYQRGRTLVITCRSKQSYAFLNDADNLAFLNEVVPNYLPYLRISRVTVER